MRVVYTHMCTQIYNNIYIHMYSLKSLFLQKYKLHRFIIFEGGKSKQTNIYASIFLKVMQYQPQNVLDHMEYGRILTNFEKPIISLLCELLWSGLGKFHFREASMTPMQKCGKNHKIWELGNLPTCQYAKL